MAVQYIIRIFENICVRDISHTKKEEGICAIISVLFQSGNSFQLVSSGTRNEKRVGKTRSSEMMLEGGTQGVIPPPPLMVSHGVTSRPPPPPPPLSCQNIAHVWGN